MVRDCPLINTGGIDRPLDRPVRVWVCVNTFNAYESRLVDMSCPQEFKDNCWYSESYCYRCAAVDCGNKLEYKPIEGGDLSFKNHPYFIENKKQSAEHKRSERIAQRSTAEFKVASTNSRSGRNVERKVARELGATMTAGSGAVFGNGDFYIGDYYVEHKLRINNKNVLGPRQDEWDKARGQGCSIFMTTSDKAGTIVTMSKETFMELISNEEVV